MNLLSNLLNGVVCSEIGSINKRNRDQVIMRELYKSPRENVHVYVYFIMHEISVNCSLKFRAR